MKLNFPGVPVYMNGQNYYIPSLSTRGMIANYDKLTAQAPEGAAPFESFGRLLPIIGEAIRRNYPDVTDEQLGDWLDLHTFPIAIKAVQDASGMTPVTEGE